MRAWTLVLLLLATAFQSAWASAAVHCRHDADVSIRHVGHHEHRHASPAEAKAKADSAASSDVASGALDNDCGYCHLSCVQPPTASARHVLLPAAHSLVPSPPGHCASGERDRIDRPNWRGLVRSASLEELRIT